MTPPDAANAVTFVLCIEGNAIRNQSLLLCESIRAFTGRYRHAPIVAVAPRAGLGVDADTRQQLDDLHVDYVEEPLNQVASVYGSANRVFAAAYVEAHSRSEWIVVLDSDTVFIDEPLLPDDADVGARPVDSKGSATTGPGDRFEEYWAQLAALDGLTLDELPFVQTTDRTARVRSSYNGGLIVARRRVGVLAAWADLFARSVTAGLRPWKGSQMNAYASTGFVGVEASEFWGSNQAAAAIAIWRRTHRVHLYPDSYNVPLHMFEDLAVPAPFPTSRPLVHLHYHWMFNHQHADQAQRLMRTAGVAPDRLDWLAARMPLR